MRQERPRASRSQVHLLLSPWFCPNLLLTDTRFCQAILEAGVKEAHAMLFFMGADVTKYGSLLRKLRSDYGRRLPNVHPKDLQDAVNTLNTHTWDQAHHDAKKQKRQQAKEQKQKEPASESNQTSFAQKGKDIICFVCDDHIQLTSHLTEHMNVV